MRDQFPKPPQFIEARGGNVWAERYEREQGRIRCPQRVENNAGRDRGEWVRCASMKPGRYRRGPRRESESRRRHSPAGRNARDGAAALGRREFVRNLEQGQRQQWGQLYRRHEQERRKLSQDWGSLQGRVRQWRAQGKHWDELAGAIRGKSQVRAEWEQGIEWQNRRERAVLVRDHGLESRRVEQEWAAVGRRREQEAARGREPGPSQQQQERKPAKNNEEHFRKIADDPIKKSGPSVGPQRPEREQEAVAARQREAELRRAQEAAEAAERELARQREAAAELERAAAAEKAKIARDRPAVVTVEEIVAQRAAAIEAEGAAWLSDKKALAGQWSEEKEKAAQEEGRQSEAKNEKVIPLHERWAPPKKEGLVKRIISARREAAAERQREQDNKAWETSRPEREQQERARRAWIVVESPYFQKLPVGQQHEIGARWDEKFPPPHEIESPWEREKRIEQVMRGMNQAAYDRRQWDLDAPKRAREAAWRAKIALEREQQPTRTRNPGPMKDYGPSR